MHGLGGVLDRHFVEHHRIGLADQVRSNHRQQRGETVFVIGERIAESRFRGASARPQNQIDMGNFISVTDQSFANHHSINLFCLCHFSS